MFVAWEGLDKDMNETQQHEVPRTTDRQKFCWHCGVPLNPEQIICVKCGARLSGYASAEGSMPSYHYDPALSWVIPISASGWSVAAGYFGLFAVLVFPAPIAFILGIVALQDCKKRSVGGKGRAIFAIVMGTIFSLPLPLILVAIASGL